jgi:hypothetical protein
MPPHEKKEGLTIFLAGNWQPAQIGGVYITPLCERQTGFSIFFFRLILDPIPGDGLFPALAPSAHHLAGNELSNRRCHGRVAVSLGSRRAVSTKTGSVPDGVRIGGSGLGHSQSCGSGSGDGSNRHTGSPGRTDPPRTCSSAARLPLKRFATIHTRNLPTGGLFARRFQSVREAFRLSRNGHGSHHRSPCPCVRRCLCYITHQTMTSARRNQANRTALSFFRGINDR